MPIPKLMFGIGLVGLHMMLGAVTSGQGLSDDNPEFEKGEFQIAAPYMSQLLKLQYGGDRDELLVFSREWKDPFEGKTTEEIQEVVAASLASRDEFSEGNAESLTEWIVRVGRSDRRLRRRSGRKPGGFEMTAQAVGMFVTTKISSTGGVSEGTIRMMRDGMSLQAQVNGENFSFHLQELTGPGRTMNVTHDSDNHLTIEVFGNSYVVRLEQGTDGKFRSVYSGPEHSQMLVAENFKVWLRRYPTAADSWLIPFLQHMGIGTADIVASNEENSKARSGNVVVSDAAWKTDGNLFEDGRIQDVKASVFKMVKLRNKAGRLVLSRRFSEFGGIPDARAKRASIRRQMSEHAPEGFSIDAAMARLKDEDLPGSFQAPVKRAFEDFSSPSSKGGSHGTSGNGNSLRLIRGFDGLSVEGVVNHDRILIRLVELDAPGRTMYVVDSGEGDFYILISGRNSFCEIRQMKSGEFRIARQVNDKFSVESAGDFDQFLTNHWDLAEKWLYPLFEHLGIDAPKLINLNDD